MEIPEKQWTLVIGYDVDAEKCTVVVNGVEMSALPESPKTPPAELCRSDEKKKYSETIK